MPSMMNSLPNAGGVLGEAAQSGSQHPPLDPIERARRHWNAYRFAELPDAVDSYWLREQASLLWPALRPIAETAVSAPRLVNGAVADGWRYKRVDPGRPGLPDYVRAPMLELYERMKLHAWGAELSRRVEPIVSAILGDIVRYDRVYFLLYEADDYIGPHNDEQTGQRVNVQFPIAVGAATGLRVLDYDWHTYRDTPGLLRILGPLVWHEVLPLIGAHDAYRLNISLRYWLQK